MTASYKLYYFPIKGLGEIPRQIFAAANRKFEDIRIQYKDWPKMKADNDKTFFSQVPILVVNEDGNEFKIAQSNTIARYLARKFDLAGKSEIEKIRVEMVLDYVQEFHAFFRQIRMASLGKDEAYGANKTISPEEGVEKLKLRTEQLTKCLPDYLKFLNKMLDDQSTKFLASNELTAADVALSVMLDRYGKYLGNGLDNFPRLKEINQTINDLPGVKTYKENRPVSTLEGTLE